MQQLVLEDGSNSNAVMLSCFRTKTGSPSVFAAAARARDKVLQLQRQLQLTVQRCSGKPRMLALLADTQIGNPSKNIIVMSSKRD